MSRATELADALEVMAIIAKCTEGTMYSETELTESAALLEEMGDNAELIEHLRDGLQRSCDAIDRFGFRSDEHGGPHLSDVIKTLGEERDTQCETIAAQAARIEELTAALKSGREVIALYADKGDGACIDWVTNTDNALAAKEAAR